MKLIKNNYVEKIKSVQKYSELVFIVSEILNSNNPEFNNKEIESLILNKSKLFKKDEEIFTDALKYILKY